MHNSVVISVAQLILSGFYYLVVIVRDLPFSVDSQFRNTLKFQINFLQFCSIFFDHFGFLADLFLQYIPVMLIPDGIQSSNNILELSKSWGKFWINSLEIFQDSIRKAERALQHGRQKLLA